MGKAKTPKGGDGIPQRHLHARISYLHQAATYLATTQGEKNIPGSSAEVEGARPLKFKLRRPQSNQTKHLLSQLQGVSKKSQIRLARNLKHSLCKRCDALLISGVTSSEQVTNSSIDERKPWADVFEIGCRTCGTVKRFPIGQKLSKAKANTDREGLAQNEARKEVAEHVVGKQPSPNQA